MDIERQTLRGVSAQQSTARVGSETDQAWSAMEWTKQTRSCVWRNFTLLTHAQEELVDLVEDAGFDGQLCGYYRFDTLELDVR